MEAIYFPVALYTRNVGLLTEDRSLWLLQTLFLVVLLPAWTILILSLAFVSCLTSCTVVAVHNVLTLVVKIKYLCQITQPTSFLNAFSKYVEI